MPTLKLRTIVSMHVINLEKLWLLVLLVLGKKLILMDSMFLKSLGLFPFFQLFVYIFCQDFVSIFSANDKCPQIPSDDPDYDESKNLGLIIGIPIGFVLLIVVALMTCYCKG